MKSEQPSHLQPAPATDTSVALEQRLRQNTRGEVLFDAASRGRYATDASIYQVMPVGVFVPTDDADVRTAIQIAREIKVPVLPRGAGTSQCGQSVGACLVIDGSKHLRNLLALDVERRTARVQPGLVLDHLNAQLKSHGLWYPVDVSTSAQATLGGMAGNNSCGSRSIAYGNMVHNVTGAHLRLADGAALHAGPVGGLSGRAAETAQFVRALVDANRSEIEAHWPRVMRRVAGYNLDIFHPQSERPYTANGNVNLAHLFIGAEGTLGFIEALDLRLQPLPRAKVLGVVNFASFHRAMDSAQNIVQLKPKVV
jgi:FAD/FMN-containing dehydrogenase